jgi:hypothetical protein
MTTQTAIFFSHLEKCPYELPEGIKPHLEEALKKAYGVNATAVIAQKKPKQETGYNRFVKEKTIELKAQNVPSETRMKQIRDLWHQLDEQSQNAYTIKAGGTIKPKVKTSPKAEPTAETTKAEAPVAKVEAPVAKVEEVGNLATPIKKVPLLKPQPKVEVPVAKVEAPVAKVEVPVAKVEAPVAKVEAPVAKVEAPVAKVEAPTKKAVVAKKSVVVEAPVVVEGVVVEGLVAKKEVVKTGAGYNHFKKVRTEELK